MTKPVFVSDDALVALLDEGEHAETLTVLSSRALQNNEPYQAFIFADRRCRIAPPRPYDLLIRGEALRRLGYESAATDDLGRARSLSPTDPLVNTRLMASGHPSAAEAARWIIGDPRAGADVLDRAIQVLQEAGAPVVGRFVVENGRLTGWVAWRGPPAYALDLVTSAGRVRIAMRPTPKIVDTRDSGDGRMALDRRLDGSFVDLAIVGERQPIPGAIIALRVNPHGAEPDEPESRQPAPEAAATDASASGAPLLVTVIVPVYDDVDVTDACLASLAGQVADGLVIYVIIVDDAAPSPAMRALLVETCERHGFCLIVNDSNLGFIGAVNKALDQVRTGDVVLLNSDVVLPSAALAKLAGAAHARPGIGIVNPLTNNGQFNSFPSSTGTNVFESALRIEAIDDMAGRIGAGQVVLTPGGIGYCMYVTRACLDAVGKMPEVYLRGYYEDVEFCLRARQRGFASVCAVDVYVGHKGTASFKGEKSRLVARNERALRGRYPAHAPNCDAFRWADPLRSTRGVLESVAFPLLRMDVIVAGGSGYASVLKARADQLESSGVTTLVLSWSVSNGRTVVRLRPATAAEPLQTDYECHAGHVQADLVAAIDRVGSVRIEVAGAAGPLDATLTALVGRGLAFGVLLCESLGRSPVLTIDCPSATDPEPCLSCLDGFDRNWTPQGIGHTLARSLHDGGDHPPALIVPTDDMAQELAVDLAGDVFRDARLERFAAPAIERLRRQGSRRAILGVLYPDLDLAAERLVLALASAARRQNADWFFVVFGRSHRDRRLMSTGNLFVTGPIAQDEAAADVLDYYGVAAVFAPQRWRGYGPLVQVATALDVPKAYFDWSIGAVRAQPRDLAIDPRVCDAKAAAAMSAWLAHVAGQAA